MCLLRKFLANTNISISELLRLIMNPNTTLPRSPVYRYVERKDVSWYDNDSADEGEDEEEGHDDDGQQRGQRVMKGSATPKTLQDINGDR